MQNDLLTLPHKELLLRPFALLPFADIAPHWQLEGHYKTVAESASQIKKNKKGFFPFQTKRSLFTLTKWVGILNLTPDSFSDGGSYNTIETALKRAKDLARQGASVIDIGAESTAPNATPLSSKQEWQRLAPILEAIVSEFESQKFKPFSLLTSISIDTRHPETAKKAIQQGVNWINDVSGLENPKMRKIIADSHVSAVVMHSLSIPLKKTVFLEKKDPLIPTLLYWGEKRIQMLIKKGITRDRIIFDPGIGFGKTKEQNWEIVRNAHRFHELGVKILIGHSRKSFLTTITKHLPKNRDLETLAISQKLVEKNIHFLRIHNLKKHMRALKAWTQI